MISIKHSFLFFISFFLLTACGGGGSSNTTSGEPITTSTTKVDTSNLAGKSVLVGNGFEYYSVAEDGSFSPKDIQRSFTVYDKESEDPLLFSYANKNNVLIDEYSTAFYLATKNFPPIYHADADLLAQYNSSIRELPVFDNLAKKIKESIALYNKIDMTHIDAELNQAYLFFKESYEKGVLNSELNSEKIASEQAITQEELAKIAGKETITYPKFRGVRLEEVQYTKNTDDTYTVDLTIRNSNPAYLGMKLADVSYKDGQYHYIGRYDNEYTLIDPGNTSNFYKSFSTAKGIGQFVEDIASASQLIKEHGFITGTANSNFGESVTKVSGLTLSCDKDAVVISANDTKTLVTNAVFLTLDLIDVMDKLPNAIEKTKTLRTTAVTDYSSSSFKKALAKNIISNKDFVKEGIV